MEKKKKEMAENNQPSRAQKMKDMGAKFNLIPIKLNENNVKESFYFPHQTVYPQCSYQTSLNK